MGLSDWLDKVIDDLKEAGAVRVPTTGSHQTWILGDENPVLLPARVTSDAGRGRANCEAAVARAIASHFKRNPGLLERMEQERRDRRKGMSPKDVERLIEVRGPKEPPLPVSSPSPPVITVQPPPLVVQKEALDQALQRAKEERIYIDPVAPERIPEPLPLEFEHEEVPHMNAADHPQAAHSPMVEEEVTSMATPTTKRPGRGRPGVPRSVQKGRTECPYCPRKFGAPPPLGRHVKNEHADRYEHYCKNFTTNRPSQQRGPRVGLPEEPVNSLQPEPVSARPRKQRLTKAERMVGQKVERKVPPIDAEPRLMEALNIIQAQVTIMLDLVPKMRSELNEVTKRNLLLEPVYDAYLAMTKSLPVPPEQLENDKRKANIRRYR